MSSFVHLHCHTEYSLLEGALRIPELIDAAVEMNSPAVAITDNGVMYGAIDFYLRAKSKGLNPIIGCEMYVVPDMKEKVRGWDRLVLLCKSYKGYQNLIGLVSQSHLEGFYYKPRIDLENLAQHTEDLIAISPGFNGPVAYNLRQNQDEQAKAMAIHLKELYKDDFYLGLQKLDMPFEDLIEDGTFALSKELDIPIVATNDVHYLTAEKAHVRDVLMCIQTGRRLEDDNRVRFQSHEMFFRSPDQMQALFSEHPEVLENSIKIAEKCHLEIETEQVLLPIYECPGGQSAEVYLEKLVWEGINKRYPVVDEQIKDRVKFELNTINSMQYAPYFLIIWDFLDYCEKEEIPVGPGRGSAAGSIVSYALNITRIDPLKYHLLFERFLNPERVSMPDIDIDFCIRRRQQVIDYLSDRWGEERISQIVTFGTMAARGVIRDVGRVLGIPLSDVDKIAKLIPSTPGKYTSIPEAMEEVKELRVLVEQSVELKELIELGTQLEGISRHTSTHAAGVVISKDPLTKVVPLIKNDGQVATQYAMADIEKIGLLKMDILGLRNLTVISDALKNIKLELGVSLDLDKLEVDDEKTYDLLCTGETMGIFQLESRGMRQLIKDLKPRVFEDLIALLALYRPGPLGSGMVQDFISNKSGKTKVKYELKELEPILKDTYGLIVYQEQVMQIASLVGGFSLGQADMLRRAMGKKKKDVMDKMKDDFLAGAEERNFNVGKAKKIFDLMYKFAEYGFNKSHSAAYALISYQTAYLKAHYPVIYMAALLSSVLGNSEKTSSYIEDCRNMGIEILPPDINESNIDFTVIRGETEDEQPRIRFGLRAIKNVGDGAIESIVKERNEGEPFKTLLEFLTRVDLKQVNKRVVESLIMSGATDSVGDRSDLLGIFEQVLERAQTVSKELARGQESLFGGWSSGNTSVMDVMSNENVIELSKMEMLVMEKEMLGLYVSGHPLEEVRDKLETLVHNSKTLRREDERKDVVVAGLLANCRKLITRNQQEMYVGNLVDLHGTLPVVLFMRDQAETAGSDFEDDHIVLVKGKVRCQNDEISISANSVSLIEKSGLHRRCFIDIGLIDDTTIFNQIKDITLSFKGSVPVYFKVGENYVTAHRKYWIKEDPICLSQLENLVGKGQLWLV